MLERVFLHEFHAVFAGQGADFIAARILPDARPDGIVEHILGLAADFGVSYYVSSFPAAMQLGPVIARLKGTTV